MIKYLTFLIILIELVLAENIAIAKTIRQIYNVPSTNNNYYYQNSSPYNKDLSQIEDYLFGKTYKYDSPTSRLNRIEMNMFNKSYPNLSIAQRMNRAIENYRDDYYNRNNLPQYYANSSIRNRIRNNLFGQPTGFTPPIFTNSYNNPSSGIDSYYSGNRGYGFNNFVPGNMGMGIHILD